MKKLLLLSIGMSISAYAGMTLSSYAFVSDETLLEDLFEEAGITETYTKDTKELENLAANEELPFGNLYLFMLQNIINGPEDAAIETLSDQYLGIAGGVKYTEEELRSVVLEGDTQVIIDKYTTLAQQAGYATDEEREAKRAESDAQMEEFMNSNDFSATTEGYLQWKYGKTTQYKAIRAEDYYSVLSQTGLFAEFNSLSEAYKKELEFQRNGRKASYEALASEMFFNNDLEDSANIDILYDLDLIHYLLFGEYITYPDRSEGGDVSLASDPSEELDFPDALTAVATPAPSLSREEPEEDVEVVLAATTAVDPYTCTEDDALVDALEAYEEDPPETGLEEAEETSIDYDLGDDDDDSEEEDDEETGDDDDDNSSDEGEEETDVAGAMEALDEFITALEGQVGDWTRSLPCGEVFCIEVKVITETDDPEVADYEETENCIACHTQYISERMQETTSKSLVPSKVSMNWFEDATCKEAGNDVGIDLNIYAIKKPIDLDPGDDIDEEAQKDIDDLKTRLFGVSAIPLPGDSKTILGTTLSELECSALLNINDIAGTNRSIDELMDECKEQAEAIEEETAEIYEEFTFDVNADNLNTLYGQVSQELYTMLLYFRNFQEGLKATYESEDAPLSSLIAKGYCQ